MTWFALCLAALAAMGWAQGVEPGLVAHWDFDEGHGDVLHDHTGNGNDGIINGAQWVPSGAGFALRFDGVDDTVDCGAGPTLNLTQAITLEAWVWPQAVPGQGEALIVGKDYGSYALTYYTDGQAWWYISGGGNNCKAPLGTGAWHHVAGTFDGTLLKLYVDGRLAGTQDSRAPTINAGQAFVMGTMTVPNPYTKGTHFHGMLDEVRVYNRALSPEEIMKHYRTTHVTGDIVVRPAVYYFTGTLQAELDLRGLGELPEGAWAQVEFGQPGAAPLQQQRIPSLPQWGGVEATLKPGDLAPGQYELRAQVTGPDGKQIGKTATCQVTWPEKPAWKDAPRAKVLNNLVTELANQDIPETTQEAAAGQATPISLPVSVINPRDGWLFIRSEAKPGEAKEVTVSLGGQPLHVHRSPGTLESMRWLPKGRVELLWSAEAPSGPGKLIVRSIPELGFAAFGAHPHVHEYGKYDWEFLSKHVNPQINVMFGGGGDPRELIQLWHQEGKRWMAHCGVPGLVNADVEADEAEKYWSQHPGMADPALDGVIADEFGGGDGPQYVAWTNALRAMAANPQLKGKAFYPYCGAMYGARGSRELIQAVIDAGWKFAFERYLPEQRTAEAARAYLHAMLPASIAAWEEAQPGAVAHMMVCIGYFSQPPESLDVNPQTNHKVYLDMQLNLLANHPACFGLGGVMTYLCSYSDEETVRWAAKLFRHYCLEGRTEPFTNDPYMLPHLTNGDFEEGLAGWTAMPAEEGSIATKTSEGFSWLQGRYPPTPQGNTVLWLKRSAAKPNKVSQTVRALEPGRLYSLRMYSGDFRDLAVQQKHALAITLDNAEVLRDRSIQHVFANCYSHHYGPFNDRNKAWMNYHWMLFRPQGTEATLTISDWASETDPGGPIGQELMLNFVQVQPYD